MFFEIFGVGRFFLHIPSLADSPTRSLNVVQNGSKIRTFWFQPRRVTRLRKRNARA